MTLRWAPCWLLLLQSACTVSAVAEKDPRPRNTCSTNAECGNNHCSSGVCQEVNGTLESLLVTVTPPSSSSLPQFTFVTTLEDVPTSGGTLDLSPPPPHRVRGSLSLPAGVACYPTFFDESGVAQALRAPDGKSLPVDITLSLGERHLGLTQQVYFDSAKTLAKLDEKTGSYTFDMVVPGGRYDVYVAPPPNQDPACAIPPQLWRDYPIQGSESMLPLSLVAAPPTDLTVTIHWPGGARGGDLTGWTADIIEPVGGNRLSTVATLGKPVGTSTTVEYTVPLRYSPATEVGAVETPPGSDLLRLRPPASLKAPVMYWDLSALRLFDPKNVDVTAFSSFPSAVKVQGLLTRADTGAPIAGYVTLVSKGIGDVDAGVFASFKQTLRVGDDGVIDLELPPGTYQVQGVPGMQTEASGPLDLVGSLRTTWVVASTPAEQFGKTLELPTIAELTGQSQVQGSQVQAVPVSALIGEFAGVFGDTALDDASGASGDPSADEPNVPKVLSPRATTALVDTSGHFSLRADLGLFNVSVRGPESLGFAWFVRPGVAVTGENQDLGRMNLLRPTLVSGACLVGLGDGRAELAPQATIRAYAYLDKDLAYTRDPGMATTVIQVAETRTDEVGGYRLLLPPSLASPR